MARNLKTSIRQVVLELLGLAATAPANNDADPIPGFLMEKYFVREDGVGFNLQVAVDMTTAVTDYPQMPGIYCPESYLTKVLSDAVENISVSPDKSVEAVCSCIEMKVIPPYDTASPVFYHFAYVIASVENDDAYEFVSVEGAYPVFRKVA